MEPIYSSAVLTPLRVAQLSQKFYDRTTENVAAVKTAFPESTSKEVAQVVLNESVTPSASPVEVYQALVAAAMDPPTDDPFFVAAGFAPDFVVRDTTQDSGDEYTLGPFWRSPDIIGSNAPLADPLKVFANPGLCFGQRPTATRPAYYYVRIQNHGTMTAKPEVEFFWAEQSSFVAPEFWHPWGKLTDLPALDPGDTTIAGPMPLKLPAGASAENLVVIAVVNYPLDPQVMPQNFTTYSDFVKWVAGSNNVAMRAVNELGFSLPPRKRPFPKAKPYEPKPLVLPRFFLRAAPFVPDRYSLAITTNLPEGTRIRANLDHGKENFLIVGGLAYVLFSSIRFQPSQKVHAEVEIDLPYGIAAGDYFVDMRQTADRYTVGGITTFVRVEYMKS